MAFSRGPRAGRAFLQMESLEDRLTPVYDPSLPLGPQVAAGDILGDRVTVVMNSGASSAVLSAAPFATEARSLGFNIYSVRLAAGTDLTNAIAYLAAQPGVQAAEPDLVVRADRRPNDTDYKSLYGIPLTGTNLAWNVSTGNPDFVIAVIDSGVDYTHPDLAANIWTNLGEIPDNGVDDDGNGYVDDVHGYNFSNNTGDPLDVDPHGTHVAGTIGAVGNNGDGVTGINWNVKIMALNFLGTGPDSGALSGAIASLNYAVTMGAKVSNNSWGSDGGGRSAAFTAARDAGHIFVSSAGNGGFDGVGDNNDQNPLRMPSNYSTQFDNVIAVAAIDNNNQLGSFSNYGVRTVTLAAPGVQILSTVPGGGYDTYDGTSMATPHVAGAIALYWGANPTLTYQQVIDKLKSSVDVYPNLIGKVATGGRLNVANMFDYVPTIPPVVVPAPVGSDVVRVLAPGGTTELALTPHPGYMGGVTIASGDVTGDGVADAVTAASFGGHVKVFDGATGAELRSFYAFAGYRGPIDLAVGDVNGDGIGDIIVAANLNGHIKVFDGRTGAMTFSQFVYAGYAGAIKVSVADTNGDGVSELITAAEGGLGVHVKTFAAGTQTLRDSFLATPPGFWKDFSLSAFDMDGDEVAELLVSQGPRVRVVNAETKAVRADFLAFDPLSNVPVVVQAGQFKGNNKPQLVVIAEPQGKSHVKVFDGPDFTLYDSFYAGTR